ncbi:MAG: exodeoxyribonuclease large subunit [Francisellaceae bacterium]|nr:exodeoxyribonuclease large subunit [Francisellaceae bacterium]
MQADTLTVSQLNQSVRNLLETEFPLIWVEGEISNLSQPASGHLYFSLKDKQAQVRCAMFRVKSGWLNFNPENGLQVKVRAKVSVYPDRGDYQLIVQAMESIGDGDLRKAYDLLVQKLASLGLFQDKWKKPIPVLPKHIGVVTSPTGAAIRDILIVLKRRFPSIPVTIYPALVQGTSAANEICKMIEVANSEALCDVLIVGRGGGSLEDLWPFNEEKVAYAIFESKIPIISAVGHEIDFTISDLVADCRAPTPSAAAELVSPDRITWFEQFKAFEQRFCYLIEKLFEHRAQQLDWLQKRLRHPGILIEHQLQQFNKFELLLMTSLKNTLYNKKQILLNSVKVLETLSPLATLNRGFSIVTLKKSNQIVRDARQTEKGTIIDIQLQKGNLLCEVI